MSEGRNPGGTKGKKRNLQALGVYELVLRRF